MRALFCWALTAGCDKQHLARAKTLKHFTLPRSSFTPGEERGFYSRLTVGERMRGGEIVISQVLLNISECISCKTEASQRRAGGLGEEGISHELWLNTT